MTYPEFDQPNMPVPVGEAVVSPETPFSLEWLSAFHPETFTPQLWVSDKVSPVRIILRPPEGEEGGAIVERYTTWHNDDTRKIVDEPHLGDTSGPLPHLSFTFSPEGSLIGCSTAQDSEQLEGIVAEMGRLVYKPGSTMTGWSQAYGIEALFKSDGTQWLDQLGQPLLRRPAIDIVRLAIEASEEL